MYKKAKLKPFSYGFLSEKMDAWLKPNHGVIIYHEDLIKIIAEYSGWDFGRSNLLRRACMNKNSTIKRDQDPNWIEFQKKGLPLNDH